MYSFDLGQACDDRYKKAHDEVGFFEGNLNGYQLLEAAPAAFLLETQFR
jgi:hypothetical protein